MEAWLSFHDVTTVQNCEARVLNLLGTWSHCKHMTYYMTAIIQPSDLMKCECPIPSSAKATIISSDHNSNIKNAWNNINGIRMKHQSLLSAQHKVHVHQESPSQFDMVIALGLGTRLTWRLSNNTLKSDIRAYILCPYGDVACTMTLCISCARISTQTRGKRFSTKN